MSDLKDALERLREDVSAAGTPPADAVRRDADRGRPPGQATGSAGILVGEMARDHADVVRAGIGGGAGWRDAGLTDDRLVKRGDPAVVVQRSAP